MWHQGRNWLSKSGGASSNMAAMAARRRCRWLLLFWPPYSYAPGHSSSREGVDIKVCLQFYVKSCMYILFSRAKRRKVQRNCNFHDYFNVQQSIRGHPTTTSTKFKPILTYYPPWVDNVDILHDTKPLTKRGLSTDHLPTYSCSRRYIMPPYPIRREIKAWTVAKCLS